MAYALSVPGSDPLLVLQEFINERWEVVKPTYSREISGPPRVPPELTPGEAEWLLAAVGRAQLAGFSIDVPLFEIDEHRKMRSDRYAPLSSGSPRGYLFFEEAGQLRLETLVQLAAMARLHYEFGWPREHLICESPSVIGDDGTLLLQYDALDILALEYPSVALASKMSAASTRCRVAVETKADAKLLDRLVRYMRGCDGELHPEHAKCRAIDVLHPRLFLGVAAGETWRLFSMREDGGRVSLGDELSTLDRLRF